MRLIYSNAVLSGHRYAEGISYQPAGHNAWKGSKSFWGVDVNGHRFNLCVTHDSDGNGQLWTIWRKDRSRAIKCETQKEAERKMYEFAMCADDAPVTFLANKRYADDGTSDIFYKIAWRAQDVTTLARTVERVTGKRPKGEIFPAGRYLKTKMVY